MPEWATPLVVVPKPNGIRLCGDYRVTVNPQMNIDKHPLPKIEDILASLGSVNYISVVDLSQAYLQMELDEESKKLCVINTHKGLYRMNRLPYGISAAPAIFQREMDHILRKIPGVKCLLDDILIAGRTKTEAISRLNQVLTKIRKSGLKLKRQKCQLLQNEVKYLGYIISKDGISRILIK